MSIETREVRATATYYWLAIIVMAGSAIGLVVFAVIDGRATPAIGGGMFAALGLAIFAAMKFRPVIFSVSADGIYVRQLRKTSFVWSDLSSIHAVDMQERLDQAEKAGTAALGGVGSVLAVHIGLSFTKKGRKKHGSFLNRLAKTQFHSEDAVIKTDFFPTGPLGAEDMFAFVAEMESLRKRATRTA